MSLLREKLLELLVLLPSKKNRANLDYQAYTRSMLHDHEFEPENQSSGEVIPIAKVLNDAWRSVFAFSLTGQLPPDHPIRPHQVGSFLRHPKPDLAIPGVKDYYAVLLELGVLDVSGRKIWPGEVPEYGFPEAAHIIHERLNMTMRHISDITSGQPRALFSDEELEETVMVLQEVENKYQGHRAELPWYFEKVAPLVPDEAFVSYQF